MFMHSQSAKQTYMSLNRTFEPAILPAEKPRSIITTATLTAVNSPMAIPNTINLLKYSYYKTRIYNVQKGPGEKDISWH